MGCDECTVSRIHRCISPQNTFIALQQFHTVPTLRYAPCPLNLSYPLTCLPSSVFSRTSCKWCGVAFSSWLLPLNDRRLRLIHCPLLALCFLGVLEFVHPFADWRTSWLLSVMNETTIDRHVHVVCCGLLFSDQVGACSGAWLLGHMPRLSSALCATAKPPSKSLCHSTAPPVASESPRHSTCLGLGFGPLW